MSPNVRGVLWALVAALLFSLEVALVKAAAASYAVVQVLFFRQLAVLASVLPALARDGRAVFRTRRPGLHALRLGGALVALVVGTWALGVLPLTTVVTIGFAKVLFGALLARWFLGENVGVHRLGAVLVGFVGVAVLLRPGVDGLLDPLVLIALGGAVGAAVAQTCVRRLSQSDSTATLLVYQALVIGLAVALPLPWMWKTPNAGDLLLLVAIGVLATAGQWVAVHALRLGEASVVGPVDYVRLVYAAAIGFLAFGEVPDGYTLIGAAIIVSASLYIVYREAQR